MSAVTVSAATVTAMAMIAMTLATLSAASVLVVTVVSHDQKLTFPLGPGQGRGESGHERLV